MSESAWRILLVVLKADVTERMSMSEKDKKGVLRGVRAIRDYKNEWFITVHEIKETCCVLSDNGHRDHSPLVGEDNLLLL